MICPRCGQSLREEHYSYCPKCGTKLGDFTEEIPPPYSGSVSIFSTGCMAHQQIEDAFSMYQSISSTYPGESEMFKPIIDKISEIKKITQEQDDKIATLEKTQKDFKIYRDALEEYKKLVDAYKEEKVYQDFLKGNPNIFNLHVKTTYSKYKLADELIPDFLLILHDITHLFVEIEKPSDLIFNKDNVESTDLKEALKQVRDFMDWASDELDHLRKRGCPDIHNNNIKGLLIIGHNSQLDDQRKRELQKINYMYQGKIEVKTFDQLYYERIADLESICGKLIRER